MDNDQKTTILGKYRDPEGRTGIYDLLVDGTRFISLGINGGSIHTVSPNFSWKFYWPKQKQALPTFGKEFREVCSALSNREIDVDLNDEYFIRSLAAPPGPIFKRLMVRVHHGDFFDFADSYSSSPCAFRNRYENILINTNPGDVKESEFSYHSVSGDINFRSQMLDVPSLSVEASSDYLPNEALLEFILTHHQNETELKGKVDYLSILETFQKLIVDVSKVNYLVLYKKPRFLNDNDVSGYGAFFNLEEAKQLSKQMKRENALCEVLLDSWHKEKTISEDESKKPGQFLVVGRYPDINLEGIFDLTVVTKHNSFQEMKTAFEKVPPSLYYDLIRKYGVRMMGE